MTRTWLKEAGLALLTPSQMRSGALRSAQKFGHKFGRTLATGPHDLDGALRNSNRFAELGVETH
jgi:hypothetical protein